MNMRLFITLFLLLCALRLTASGGDKANDDAKKLQGTWRVVKAHRDGKQVDQADVKDVRFTFNGDAVTFQSSREKNSAQFKLDASKAPRWIDTQVADGKAKGETRLGIYDVSGKTLKLCWSRSVTRPSGFITKTGDKFFCMELERVKE